MDKISIYCLSVNNPERFNEMKDRFEKAGMQVTFSQDLAINNIEETKTTTEPCESIEPPQENIEIIETTQLAQEEIVSPVHKTTPLKTCTHGHWDFMHEFYNNSDKEYAIFIEDDVHIYKDFVKIIPHIIEDFNRMNLDILLLGYLLWENPSLILGNQFFRPIEKTDFNGKELTYYTYPCDLWGTQMYMLSRKQVKYFIEESIHKDDEKDLAADWLFTKKGVHTALLYPMLGVENGKQHYGIWVGQQNLHDNTHRFNYSEELYY